MQISVVICTYNPREKYLTRVLEALRNQTLPLEKWELILVDNASTIRVAEGIDLSWHPQGKILREDKLGKMHAWFKGISEAKGDILVFVDDDNVLESNYLEEAQAIGDQWPFIGAWGASVKPEFESTPPPWMKEQMWRLSVEEVKEDVWSNLREGFETKPLGAGMCVRKKVAAHYLEWCRTSEMSYVLDRKGEGDLITGYGEMNLSLCAIDLLKIDIEGFEYDVLSRLPTRETPISQICVELHFGKEYPYRFRHVIACVSQLRLRGYKLVHRFINDYTFIKSKSTT